jgi:hypothetical protein
MQEEIRWNQAIGYAWGMQDGSEFKKNANAIAFANWYSIVGAKDQNLHAAMKLFLAFDPTDVREVESLNNRLPFTGQNV